MQLIWETNDKFIFIMKKILLSAIVLGGMVFSAQAQDVHFSQYFASPLTLNPAQTGLIPGDWRASANFRNQWFTVSDNPYITGTIAYDMPLLRGKLPEGDALGVGVLGLFDRAGAGGYQNTTLGISVAYHKSFGIDKQHTVSLGVQGALVQKSVHADKLIFGDQYNPAIPGYVNANTQEQFTNADVTYPDFNVGALYTTRVGYNSTMYVGGSYYHLTRPEEKFISTSNSATTDIRINPRYFGYLGGSFQLNPNIIGYLSTMYQKQGPASEYLVGGAVGFIMNPDHDEYSKNTTFYLGTWYRFGDALVPYIGFEWSKMQIGFSYDVTLSNAQPMSNGQGAMEVSVIYNGLINKVIKRNYNFACPRF